MFHCIDNSKSSMILSYISQVHNDYFFKIELIREKAAKVCFLQVKSKDNRKDE